MTLECSCISHGGFLTKTGYLLMAKLRAAEAARVEGQLDVFIDGVDSTTKFREVDTTCTVRALPEGVNVNGFDQSRSLREKRDSDPADRNPPQSGYHG